MSKIKLIIFDLDDTLVETRINEYIRIKKAALSLYNMKISKKQFDKYYGIPNFNLQMKNMLKKENIDDFLYLFNQLLNKYKYKQIVEISKLIKLKEKNIILGVVTNSRLIKANKKLSSELKGMFDFFYTIEDLKQAKPNADIIIEIIKKYNLKSEECICVGDSRTDYEFAQNGNIKFVKVQTGMNKEIFKGLQFNDVNKFIDFLERNLNNGRL